ncbi:MAG: response regulator [Opitutaceae bacterium]|nr:response regulator [Opitutaceae bacterium]
MRVLIVEDERKVASLVQSGLAKQRINAEVCHHGDEALHRIATENFDGVVLDIMLPGRDGLSILRKLRADGNLVPVLLLTARGDVDERVEGLDLGADDYLAKPFAMTELSARLRAVCRRRAGLGLALSWEIVGLHGGSLTLVDTSAPGWTEFEVRFPWANLPR